MSTATSLKIKNIPMADIKPYWRNPRNNAAAIPAVKASIERYGFTQPLVLDTNNIIIAGHTRYRALLQLEWEKAPCVILDIDPELAKEYRIADNKTSELASWDMGLLIPELREIDPANIQIFFNENVENMLKEAVATATPSLNAIQNARNELETRHSVSSERAQGAYVEVTCPGCGESYYVNRDDMAKRPGVNDPNAATSQ